MKVVQLRPEVDENLVEACELLLSHAKAGNVEAGVFAVLLKREKCTWRHNTTGNVSTLVGMLELAKMNIAIGQGDHVFYPPDEPETEDGDDI